MEASQQHKEAPRFRKRGTAVRTRYDQEPNRAPSDREERSDEARKEKRQCDTKQKGANKGEGK